MGRQVVLLVIFLCCHLLLANKVQCTRNPSTEGEHDAEIQTKLLDKSSNKTIQHEDILPSGTNMIQRNSNSDLVNDRPVSEATVPTNRPHTYLAVARTKGGSGKYSGGGGDLKTDNPKAVGQQYSGCRLRLHAGFDSIEAGWRVDPDIYGGDSQTRFYIRTDGAKTHCFNTRCPGFVLTKTGFDFDTPARFSKPGDIVSIPVFIIRDNANGNWILKLGDNRTEIGYWPTHLFNGLAGLADLVEWGGVVYSPPGTPLPPMGSGRYPKKDPNYDGIVSGIKVVDEKGQESEALNTETYADDSSLYKVLDTGFQKGGYGHTILYGGPGHP